jgi:hypothetical protein
MRVPDQVRGWQWVAPSLYQDLKPLLGANTAARFIALVVPLLTGEKPKLYRCKLG